MIHTATLLHDDVVDESELRRGHATANASFGNAASVLVGDFLYSRAFQLMVTVDDMRVLQILSDATNVIAEGEVMQLMNSGNPEVDEQRYLDVIRRKTAKLFEAATRLGAVLGSASPRRRGRARALRHASRDRVSADRRRARLHRRPSRDRQEPRRRPRRRQADAAAHSRAAGRHDRAGRHDPLRHQRRRACADFTPVLATLQARPAHSTTPAHAPRRKAAMRPPAWTRCRLRHTAQTLLELSAFAVTRTA